MVMSGLYDMRSACIAFGLRKLQLRASLAEIIDKIQAAQRGMHNLVWWILQRALIEDDSWDVFWHWIQDKTGTHCLPQMNTEPSQCDACNDIFINAMHLYVKKFVPWHQLLEC